MSTGLTKKVIDGVAPITLAECVMMGDGTTMNIKQYLTAMFSNISASGNATKYVAAGALWLGDSIGVTGTVSYPQAVANKLGMRLNNKCSSGGNTTRMRAILQGLDTYTAPDLTDIDYAFIMIGHNGGVVNSTLADIPTDDTSYTEFPDTYYGNVGSCIEYLRDQKPGIKIFFITPIQSNNPGYISASAEAKAAMIELGDYYSIPVIDAHGECGICTKNVTEYTSDGTHLDDRGVPVLAEYIVNYLLYH